MSRTQYPPWFRGLLILVIFTWVFLSLILLYLIGGRVPEPHRDPEIRYIEVPIYMPETPQGPNEEVHPVQPIAPTQNNLRGPRKNLREI